MSYPIVACELRHALDINDWSNIESKMVLNTYAFSILSCSCGKCTFSKEDEKIITKKLREMK